jgi:hypothetical protein
MATHFWAAAHKSCLNLAGIDLLAGYVEAEDYKLDLDLVV